MITILSFEPHHGTDTVQVHLDVSQADAKANGWKVNELFNEAKGLKRRIGVVSRNFGGNTFFFYDPATQASLEVHLLANMVRTATQIHIDAVNGGAQSWNV